MLKKGHQVLKVNSSPCSQALLSRPRNEFIQQGGIRSLRMLCLPTFVTQVLEKIFDQILHGGSFSRPVLIRLPAFFHPVQTRHR